jgi:hypothetical protein
MDKDDREEKRREEKRREPTYAKASADKERREGNNYPGFNPAFSRRAFPP